MIGSGNASWACCRLHTKGHRRRNGAARADEKRNLATWADEYESAHDYDGCPRDGLRCICNRLPEECSNSTWWSKYPE